MLLRKKRIISLLLCYFINPFFIYTAMPTNRGFLFTIEGTEGCGKTTLIHNLHQKLSAQGHNIIITREPGATDLGKDLRTLLMNKKSPICTLSEFLLFAADRAQHFHDIIMPNLACHKIIICDRMADSSLVYQGYIKGLDQEKMKFINQWAMHDQEPDIVFYLQIDQETAMHRVQKRNQLSGQESVAFEKEILEKKQQLIDGYNSILTGRANVIILDASMSSDQVAQKAFEIIEEYIRKNDR